MAVFFIPCKLTFCKYKLFTQQLKWQMCCCNDSCWPWAKPHFIQIFIHLFPSTEFQGWYGVWSQSENLLSRMYKKRFLKIVLTTKLMQTGQSYSWNLRMKRVFMQENSIFWCWDDTTRFLWETQCDCPQRMKMRAEKWSQSKIEEGKKSRWTTWEYKALTARGNYCETRVSWNSHLAAVSHMVTLVMVWQVSVPHSVGCPPQGTENDSGGWQAFSCEIMYFGCSLCALPNN